MNFADLFEFDPSTVTWTELTGAARGIAPYPRAEHGFLTSGDRIFLCGGWTLHGEPIERGVLSLIPRPPSRCSPT